MVSNEFSLTELITSVRLVRGYRYLDRCGEALLSLEDVLDEGWIPNDPTPSAGTMTNHDMGMSCTFNSTKVVISQREFLEFSYFKDQACKILEVLIKKFQVKQINAPSFKVTWQKGFEDSQSAEAFVASLPVVTVPDKLLPILGGEPSAFSFVLCTEAEQYWNEESVLQRRRCDIKTVIQERQPPFDKRLMQRTRLLPQAQRDAMKALLNLRKQEPKVSRYAADVDVEHSFESEFATDSFVFADFLEEAWKWHETIPRKLTRE